MARWWCVSWLCLQMAALLTRLVPACADCATFTQAGVHPAHPPRLTHLMVSFCTLMAPALGHSLGMSDLMSSGVSGRASGSGLRY
jgi:hypothetical protein